MALVQVQEMQGLYGPFTLAERVIQKIWLRGDFDQSALFIASGKQLKVLDPGRWNFQGGPDFKEAQLEVDGERIVGDVEIHFDSRDWWAHAHGGNPAFNQVVLHVVLTGGGPNAIPARTADGEEPAVLYLMPLLHRDLEDYATEDALLELEQMDNLEWISRFLGYSLHERKERIQERTNQRWEQKVSFAQKRLAHSSWDEVCHQLCLEVLGYARNRAILSKLALDFPIHSPFPEPTELFAKYKESWELSGLRPANHPLKRIEQYAQILKVNPDWPARLMEAFLGVERAVDVFETARFRRKYATPIRDRIKNEILGGEIAESRFNTLMVDAFLPLADAAGFIEGKALWHHWWPGDFPVGLGRFLKQADLVGPNQPMSNGLVQGALSMFISRG